MTKKNCILLLFSLSPLLMVIIAIAKERVYFADFERANLTYWNPKFYAYMHLSARRHSRSDPMHYVNLHYKTLMPFGNNITAQYNALMKVLQQSIHYHRLGNKTSDPRRYRQEIRIDVYVYEFLSNEYRRSFVEMHYRMCDLVLTDKIFGSVFASAIPEVYRKCPFPKAEYHLQNLSYPDLPVLKTFPFQKGRVYVNFTAPKTRERLVETYIDLVIKSRWRQN